MLQPHTLCHTSPLSIHPGASHIGRPGSDKRAVLVHVSTQTAKHVAFKLSPQLRRSGLHLADEPTPKQLKAQKGLAADFSGLKPKGFPPFFRRGELIYRDQGVNRTCKKKGPSMCLPLPAPPLPPPQLLLAPPGPCYCTPRHGPGAPGHPRPGPTGGARVCWRSDTSFHSAFSTQRETHEAHGVIWLTMRPSHPHFTPHYHIVGACYIPPEATISVQRDGKSAQERCQALTDGLVTANTQGHALLAGGLNARVGNSLDPWVADVGHNISLSGLRFIPTPGGSR